MVQLSLDIAHIPVFMLFRGLQAHLLFKKSDMLKSKAIEVIYAKNGSVSPKYFLWSGLEHFLKSHLPTKKRKSIAGREGNVLYKYPNSALSQPICEVTRGVETGVACILMS